MELLEQRILAEGQVGAGDVLKVDSFINHRIDIAFVAELAKEFCRLFQDEGITMVLTVEASGIAAASLTALYLGVPMLFAKKSVTSNISGNVYAAKAVSYTHKCTNTIVVEKAYLKKEDKVLILDDFLAKGEALTALVEIVQKAGASLAGAGILIEKEYQGGGKRLREQGIRVESLAKIAELSVENGIIFSR
jgi:xanthine phosphoribosyltransferase